MKTNFNVIGVVPARYASTRFSHKLLRSLGGKTLLQWTWEAASLAHTLDKLIIACDHPDVKKAAEEFGAQTVLTSSEHKSGTDRIAEAVRDIDTKIVINIQADEPLINSSVIDRLTQEMQSNPSLVMATAKKKIEQREEIIDPNVVKVVCDREDFAVYFSRLPMPYYRQDSVEPEKTNLPPACRMLTKPKPLEGVYYKHLGIYAYTKDFLFTFKNLPCSSLEKAEKLEQLRAIGAGYKIKVIETQFDSIGVDTEEDFKQVEKILNKKYGLDSSSPLLEINNEPNVAKPKS
ncbi:MAG: 3-deoxy-manno-octulosonate cytidylyltransferase [Candidatus Omnitrophota bacterium]